MFAYSGYIVLERPATEDGHRRHYRLEIERDPQSDQVTLRVISGGDGWGLDRVTVRNETYATAKVLRRVDELMARRRRHGYLPTEASGTLARRWTADSLAATIRARTKASLNGGTP